MSNPLWSEAIRKVAEAARVSGNFDLTKLLYAAGIPYEEGLKFFKALESRDTTHAAFYETKRQIRLLRAKSWGIGELSIDNTLNTFQVASLRQTKEHCERVCELIDALFKETGVEQDSAHEG